MTKTIATAIAAAITLTAAPAVAQDSEQEGEIIVRADVMDPAPNNDTNSYWVDYKTDVSEAKRELVSDLDRTTDEEDRREAYAEYFSELRDARKDYREEMTERGYRVTDFDADPIELSVAID